MNSATSEKKPQQGDAEAAVGGQPREEIHQDCTINGRVYTMPALLTIAESGCSRCGGPLVYDRRRGVVCFHCDAGGWQ